LEYSKTVSHVKEHYQRFKKTAVSAEGSFPLIPRLDVDIVESPAYISFCKVLEILEFGDYLRDQ